MQRALASFLLVLAVVACQKAKEKPKTEELPGTGSGTALAAPETPADAAPGPKVPQVPPPFDVKVPPADASKTPSGLLYKIITEGTGKAPGPNDGVRVRYTAWHPDGTTAATTEPSQTPMDMMLYTTGGALVEGMMLLEPGGKAMFWLPAELAASPDHPEQLAYVVELVEVITAPPTPKDLAKPPGDATKEKSGVIWKKVKTTKGERPRAWDKVAMGYTGWDVDGRILESSEMEGKPVEITVEGLPPVFIDAVTHLAVGERARIWFPEAMLGQRTGHDPNARLCFEVEVSGVTKLEKPPDAPPDVAGPPPTALKTPKGVAYVVLASGPDGGAHPTTADKVVVAYTGWTTDGKRFDSSIPEGKPRVFEVTDVMPGWIDALLMMKPGDRWRIWVPEELAYKGQAQRPAGMLVFDTELVSIDAPKVQFTPPP